MAPQPSSQPSGLPSIETTPIPGLLVVRLDLREDARGWFKENWQREKMVALGLPDFGPVQNNVSFNAARGTTRGIHTEPWDKFVSVTGGRAFGAWVDMREGESFGTVFTVELNPGTAVFVPRGVGNSYQTLDDAVAYTYLVNEHWRPATPYPALDLADPTAGIDWPIPLEQAEISEKDLSNPSLAAAERMAPKRTLIVGALGQLGRALQADFPGSDLVDRFADADLGVTVLDVSDPAAVAAWPWHEYAVVLNASGYTAVDVAETPEGRPAAWTGNATVPAALARVAAAHHLTLVHYSTDYVFDGTTDPHAEDEPFSPLGVYAQSKAAGDIAVGAAPRHYLLRTSWVIGEGKNFVRTMQQLAAKGISPSVVDDQVGRLTFTAELSRATRHLVDSGAAYGTYNLSNAGEPTSWFDVARAVFALAGRDEADVSPVDTATYEAGKQTSPRPRRSMLDLTKIRATGFEPEDAMAALRRYCEAGERP